MKSKKHLQLGMNPSTASHRLIKDILFRFVQAAGHPCHQCGGALTRDTFSVEHIVPWLDTKDPVGVYFDLDNIAFSHLSCNVAAAKRPRKKYFSDDERRVGRNTNRRKLRAGQPVAEKKKSRREKYLRTGT